MKKLVITAIVAVACFGVSQGQGLVSSQSTNHAGGVWVQSSNGITLNINDIITITAGASGSFNFVTPADLSAPKLLGTTGFTIQSNRVFDVCVKAASPNFTATNIDAGIYGNVPGDVEPALAQRARGAGGAARRGPVVRRTGVERE